MLVAIRPAELNKCSTAAVNEKCSENVWAEYLI